ncbi:MAG: hypothetical protein WC759_03315 [Candidatus Micrarchaeia archaeon]|jgi:hypothetical protein
MYEELAGVNAELRYITVELMKIASERHITFQEIAAEYIDNVYFLDNAIRAGKAAQEKKLQKVANRH